MAEESEEQKALVRRGYDAVSYAYRTDDAGEGRYAPWIAELRALLGEGGAVLDLGCGCGVPVARALGAAGCRVTGVDVSGVQVRRARRLVPGGRFLEADMARVGFGEAEFDAVVCLYALIHLPPAEQPGLLRRCARWLRPGGWFLAVAGHEECDGRAEDWLGSGAPMRWTHPGAEVYRRWLDDAELHVVRQEFVPEGNGGHAFFLARRGEAREGRAPVDGPCGRLRERRG
ncbi:class I SAM-dependent methyltransferase [Streptomyces sulphureus]|uniref:class I SAM-dependent methyltransferase n=1 Tax=Streptomyces sulphureus TaxID=47758 RepID=UPI00037A2B50|nr:class I SAM-dependent methyltransferase [Streptomyces sulphureus]